MILHQHGSWLFLPGLNISIASLFSVHDGPCSSSVDERGWLWTSQLAVMHDNIRNRSIVDDSSLICHLTFIAPPQTALHCTRVLFRNFWDHKDCLHVLTGLFIPIDCLNLNRFLCPAWSPINRTFRSSTGVGQSVPNELWNLASLISHTCFQIWFIL